MHSKKDALKTHIFVSLGKNLVPAELLSLLLFDF